MSVTWSCNAQPILRGTTISNDVDINDGVDFERAEERLDRVVGKIFREYLVAKKGNGSDEEIERLSQAYDEAQAAIKALSRHDEVAIRAVLARPA